MDFSFLSSINYIPVIAAAVLYFIIGSIWFSGIFGALWQAELKKHNVFIKQPTGSEIAQKMVFTFLSNLVTAFALALLVRFTGVSTWESGLILGAISGLGLAATSISSVFIWESRSLLLFLIDAGYPLVGIIASTVLLALWH